VCVCVRVCVRVRVRVRVCVYSIIRCHLIPNHNIVSII